MAITPLKPSHPLPRACNREEALPYRLAVEQDAADVGPRVAAPEHGEIIAVSQIKRMCRGKFPRGEQGMAITADDRDITDLGEITNNRGKLIVQLGFMAQYLAVAQAAQKFVNFAQQQLVRLEDLGGMLECDIGGVGDAITRGIGFRAVQHARRACEHRQRDDHRGGQQHAKYGDRVPAPRSRHHERPPSPIAIRQRRQAAQSGGALRQEHTGRSANNAAGFCVGNSNFR